MCVNTEEKRGEERRENKQGQRSRKKKQIRETVMSKGNGGCYIRRAEGGSQKVANVKNWTLLAAAAGSGLCE